MNFKNLYLNRSLKPISNLKAPRVTEQAPMPALPYGDHLCGARSSVIAGSCGSRTKPKRQSSSTCPTVFSSTHPPSEMTYSSRRIFVPTRWSRSYSSFTRASLCVAGCGELCVAGCGEPGEASEACVWRLRASTKLRRNVIHQNSQQNR